MTARPSKPLALIGMMAAGKTTIGRRLARHWKCPFVDSDVRICRHTSKTIAQIFREQGEAKFRAIEARVILAILEEKTPPYVLALGGGAFTTPQVRARLLDVTHTLWLDVPLAMLKHRLANSLRPNMKDARPLKEDIDALYHTRQPYYRQAHQRIDVGEMNPQQIIDAIIDTTNTPNTHV